MHGGHNKLTRAENIEHFQSVHGYKYGYFALPESFTVKEKVKIYCPKHGSWMVTPHSLKSGRGCHACSGQISSSQPAKCYYARIEHYSGRVFWKIGVTGKKRSSSLWKSNYTILKEWKFKNGLKARKKEQRILKKYKEHLFNGDFEVLKQGNSELFTKDVLGLEYV